MTKLHLDILDRSGGNGSRTTEEDWLDQNTTAADNQWSSASTTFYYWDAPDHLQDAFQNLYDTHHGKNDSNRSSELPRMKTMADTKAFCAVLEVPEAVRERVTHVMQNIDISANTFGGKSYEKIILAVLSLSHDEHLSSLPPSEIEYKQRLIFDETFKDLMDSVEMGSKELRGIREQIRTKTEFF